MYKKGHHKIHQNYYRSSLKKNMRYETDFFGRIDRFSPDFSKNRTRAGLYWIVDSSSLSSKINFLLGNKNFSFYSL